MEQLVALNKLSLFKLLLLLNPFVCKSGRANCFLTTTNMLFFKGNMHQICIKADKTLKKQECETT